MHNPMKTKTHKHKEMDYDKVIKAFMLQKYLALQPMDYMDEESDSLNNKKAVKPSKVRFKKKRSLTPLLKQNEFLNVKIFNEMENNTYEKKNNSSKNKDVLINVYKTHA